MIDFGLAGVTIEWAAYRSPWVLHRFVLPDEHELELEGDEAARYLTVSLLGSAQLVAAVPRSLEPGSSIRFRTDGVDPAIDSVLIVRWLRPDGSEYLWRASF